MDEPVMTNSMLRILQRVAQAMGLQLDELGYPYREVERRGPDGTVAKGISDFDPFYDAGDAFRVMKFFSLSVEFENGLVMVRDGKGPLLIISGLVAADGPSDEESELRAARLAIVEAASNLLVRRERRASATE